MKAVWPFASLSIFLQEFWLAQTFSRCLLFRANSFDRRSKALWLYFKTRSAWIEMDSAVLNWYSGEENHWPIISRRQLKSCLGKYWLGLYRQFGLARISRLKGQDHSHNIKHIRVRIQQTLLNIDISLRNEFYCFQRNRRRLFLGTQCDTGPEFGLICWLPISIPASMDICIFFGGVHIVYKTPCTTHFPIVSPCSRLNSSPSLTNSSFLLPSSGV